MDYALSVLFSSITTQEFRIIEEPLAEELSAENFKEFSERLQSGYDIPMIFGAASINRTAAFLEDNFKQTIELSGIISFTSDASSMFVTNRYGRFELKSYAVGNDTVHPCVIFHLRDFQKDCIYVAGQSNDALAIGATALLDVNGGPFYKNLSEEDAVLITGVIKHGHIAVSPSCFHATEPTVTDLSITNLRSLDHHVG